MTAGTIFDSTKLTLSVCFHALYLMTQNKKGISAMKLHQERASQHASLLSP